MPHTFTLDLWPSGVRTAQDSLLRGLKGRKVRIGVRHRDREEYWCQLGKFYRKKYANLGTTVPTSRWMGSTEDVPQVSCNLLIRHKLMCSTLHYLKTNPD
jgi:hypothetical protein